MQSTCPSLPIRVLSPSRHYTPIVVTSPKGVICFSRGRQPAVVSETNFPEPRSGDR